MKRKFLLSFFAIAIITSGFAQALLIKNEVNLRKLNEHMIFSGITYLLLIVVLFFYLL